MGEESPVTAAEMAEQNGQGNGQHDSTIYETTDRFTGYNTSIAVDEEDEDEPTMAPR